MRKLLNKITSAILAILIVGTNFMPALVYATNEITEERVEDVYFNTSINGQSSYDAKMDEKLELNIDLAVENNGYIRGGTIAFEDNNYKIGEVESEYVEKVNEKVLRVNQINSNEKINLVIPIEFEKTDLMSEDYFSKDSKITLNAVYIDNAGKVNNITKTVQNHLTWSAETNGYLKQDLKRYLKYDDKTLISFMVSSGVNDNALPVEEKIIQLLVPILNNQEPTKVIVSGDNLNYKYQDQVLIVNKSYKNDKNQVTWNSNDDFLITYIYDTQINETSINTLAIMLAKVPGHDDLDVRTDETSYYVKDEIGNLVETSITGDDSVNKGYLYTNLNRQEDKLETNYHANYQVNIGLSEALDEIQVKENPSENIILNKKVSIDKNELISLLGEEGSIKVLDVNGTELGVLNKDNLQLNLNNHGLRFVISKPIAEGNINIKLDKFINPALNYNFNTLKATKELPNTITVTGILQGNVISNNDIVKNISLIEPNSNATLDISKEQLSTTMKNEDVVLLATLERNDITDALYKDPELLITLPSQVTGIELKDARLIYEDELVPVDFRAEGRIIYLNMKGIQTKYSSIPTANGTVVRIVADLLLYNLAVSADEKIVMQYTNRAVDNEVRTVETPIKIVAPTGFITANTGTISQSVTALNNDEVFQIPANDKEKQIKLSGTIVNNLNENASEVMFLGRVPGEDTKITDNTEYKLNSSYTTTIKTPISVDGMEADIYYSANGYANYDLSNQENGWTTEFISNAKSYLIVAKGEIGIKQKVEFNYEVEIPKNLDYEKNAVSMYSVYYNDKSEDRASKSVITSKAICINTENIPIIKMQITAEDYYTGEEIKNGDKVGYGKYVKYIIHATNTGKKAAENVNIKLTRPTLISFYDRRFNEEEEYYYLNLLKSEELNSSIENIEPGETKTIEYIAYYNTKMIDTAIDIRAELTASNVLENSTASFENFISDGGLIAEVISANTGDKVKIGETATYYVRLENNGQQELKNVSTKVYIPKYLELTQFDEGTFDEKTGELSYKEDSLSMLKFYTIEAKVVSSDEPNQEISVYAKVSFDGMEKEVLSNKEKLYVNDTKGFTATVSTNIPNKMMDTDEVEYYINVRNDSKEDATIKIFDILPNELKLNKFTVKNGTKGYTNENVEFAVDITETVKAGDAIKVIIFAKPYQFSSVADVKEIENKVNIFVNDFNMEVNSINQKIEGTLNYNTGITEDSKQVVDVHSISGKVWYDENSNSKKDENEMGMPAVPLKIYSVELGKYLQENNKDIEIYTDENGEYIFENLSKGSYIVVAKYDNEVYELCNYQVEGLLQTENTDFIEFNSNEATTNTINIREGNIYNIDLGIKDKKIFELSIKNSISKINIISGDKSKTYEFDDLTQNVELKNIEHGRMVIEYKIEITNEGNIAGYVTEIENYIPNGMQFISELNPDWYINSSGKAINNAIIGNQLQPGDKKEIRLILTKDITENTKELIHTESKINGTYNEFGVEYTTDSTLSKINYKTADILLSGRTIQVFQLTFIFISLIIVIGILAFGTYIIVHDEKFKIIKKWKGENKNEKNL